MLSERFEPQAAGVYLGGSQPFSPKTLANWRTKGTGPRYRKVGGRVLYDKADLDEWLDSCRRTSTAQQSP